ETTGQVTATGWVQLAWGDWVAADYVVPVDGGDVDAATVDVIEANAQTTEARLAQVSTLGSPLLVREAPGGEVVDLLADGTTVELSGHSENGWSQLSNGYWVAADYLVM
ncbi:MAG: SH3 domain-containing protein, partial [Prochlorothrix sp.]